MLGDGIGKTENSPMDLNLCWVMGVDKMENSPTSVVNERRTYRQVAEGLVAEFRTAKLHYPFLLSRGWLSLIERLVKRLGELENC